MMMRVIKMMKNGGNDERRCEGPTGGRGVHADITID